MAELIGLVNSAVTRAIQWRESGAQLGSSVANAIKSNPTALNISLSLLILGAVPIIRHQYNGILNSLRTGPFLWIKLAIATFLVSIEAGNTIACAIQASHIVEPCVIAAALSCLTACCLIWILKLEHASNVQQSRALFIWLILSIFFELYCVDSSSHLNSFKISAAALKLTILLLNELPKTILVDGQQRIPATYISYGCLWRTAVWLFESFTNSPTIGQNTKLNSEFQSRLLLDNFTRQWNLGDKHAPNSLARACARTLIWPFCLIAPWRLLCSLFLVLQPFLIRSVVTYMLGMYDLDVVRYIAIGLLATACFIYSGIAVSRLFLTHKNLRLATFLRGILISAIYQKTLRLPLSEAEQQAATTLLSTDIEQLLNNINIFHDVWANAFEFITCIYLLAGILGNPSMLIVFPTILSHWSGWYIGEEMPVARVAWNKTTEARIAKVSGMLSQVKAIKTIGLDRMNLSHIRETQSSELKAFKAFRWWSAVLVTSAQFCSMITYPLVLGGALFLSAWAGKLSPTDAFAVLSVIALMTEPMNNLAGSWSVMSSTMSCLQRIQEYLLLEEIHDQRKQDLIDLPPAPNGTAEPSASTDANNTNHVEPSAPMLAVMNSSPATVRFKLLDANITMQGRQESILQHVNLELKRAQVTMVVGHTGSGKSTLLRSVIGEAQVTAGSRYKPLVKTAYCGQRVWLQNKSIRKIIMANNPSDPRWYSSVLDACLLKPDLKRLPNSDLTVIGHNGIKLSGGQKHRVALARALYSKSRIVVLDDVFSSLDGDTAAEIGSNLFGPAGLLRQTRSTVVLVTYSSQLLALADQTLLIDVGGEVKSRESMTPASFRRKLRAIMVEHRTMQERAQSATNEETTTNTDEDPFNQSKFEDINTSPIATSHQREDVRRQGDWSLVLFYLGSFSSITMIIWFLSTLLLSFTQMLPVAYIGISLNKQPDDQQLLAGYVLLSLSATFFTGCSVFSWLLQLVPSSIKHLHGLLLETTLDATLSFLSSADIGFIQNLFTKDISTISSSLPTNFLKFVYLTANTATQLGIILYFTGGLHTCIAMAAFLVSLYATQFFYLRVSRELRYKELESNAPLFYHVIDTAHGLEHIRAFGWEDQNIHHAMQLLDNSQRPFYHMQNIRRWLRFTLDSISMCLAVYLVTRALFLLQNTPVASACVGVGVSLTTLISLGDNLADIFYLWTMLQASFGALDRLRSYSQQTPRENGIDKPEIELPKDWPQNGNVVFQAVTAQYDSKSPPVLEDVSVLIPAGLKIGLVGRTGSGKSSFALALLNFLEYSGGIYIDDVDIADVPPSTLRSRITTVSQDSIEFDESVRFNLCPWTMSISEEEGNAHEIGVVEILMELGLWELMAMHEGLDTKMSKLKLSHGQKKLMCIARACLHKLQTSSRLVIIDESTSGLDREAEQLALNVMEIAFWDCTIIEVAHSREALANADMILHMENGTIVEKELPKASNPSTTTTTTTRAPVAPVVPVAPMSPVVPVAPMAHVAPVPTAPVAGPSAPPSGPVEMNDVFRDLLNKSLAGEKEARRQIQAAEM